MHLWLRRQLQFSDQEVVRFFYCLKCIYIFLQDHNLVFIFFRTQALKKHTQLFFSNFVPCLKDRFPSGLFEQIKAMQLFTRRFALIYHFVIPSQEFHKLKLIRKSCLCRTVRRAPFPVIFFTLFFPTVVG